MSGRSRCSVPRNAPVANSNTKNSYDGGRPAKPGVPGSGGRPLPGGAHSSSAGNRCGWMQVHPALISWAGVTLSAEAESAVASAAPPASRAATAAAASRALTLIRGFFMIAFPSLMVLPAPEIPVADADRFAAGPGSEVMAGGGGPAGVAGRIQCAAGQVLRGPASKVAPVL